MSAQYTSSLPTVYARIKDETAVRWQRSTYDSGEFSTEFTDELPTWIPVGETFRGVNLVNYFSENCEPFEEKEHLEAKFAIYYLVIRNPDYSKVDAEPVSKNNH